MTSYTAWYMTIASLIHGQVHEITAFQILFIFKPFFSVIFFFSKKFLFVLHGKIEGVKHSGPAKMILYFTGATNILYTFGGHAVTV